MPHTFLGMRKNEGHLGAKCTLCDQPAQILEDKECRLVTEKKGYLCLSCSLELAEPVSNLPDCWSFSPEQHEREHACTHCGHQTGYERPNAWASVCKCCGHSTLDMTTVNETLDDAIGNRRQPEAHDGYPREDSESGDYFALAAKILLKGNLIGEERER